MLLVFLSMYQFVHTSVMIFFGGGVFCILKDVSNKPILKQEGKKRTQLESEGKTDEEGNWNENKILIHREILKHLRHQSNQKNSEKRKTKNVSVFRNVYTLKRNGHCSNCSVLTTYFFLKKKETFPHLLQSYDVCIYKYIHPPSSI